MSNGCWFAIAVRANRERVVEQLLIEKNYPVFLPTHRERRVWSDRIKEVALPLFPGYVFAQVDLENHASRVVSTPGVLRIVGFAGRPAPVDERELGFVRKLVESGSVVEPWPQFHPGALVRITSGALTGVEGSLVEVKNRHRLIVSISLLQRSVAVDIDRSCVELIGLGYSTQKQSAMLSCRGLQVPALADKQVLYTAHIHRTHS